MARLLAGAALSLVLSGHLSHASLPPQLAGEVCGPGPAQAAPDADGRSEESCAALPQEDSSMLQLPRESRVTASVAAQLLQPELRPAAAHSEASAAGCRCVRPNACYTNAPWGELSGLVSPVQQPNLNQPAANDPLWLADQPGAFQASGMQGTTTWSALATVPASVATLWTARDASRAVRFAANNNLAVSIKNTGHDWFGRSAYPGGNNLQLWTHRMQDIDWSNSFVPEGCGADQGAAVTVGAGTQFWKLYDGVAQQRRLVVGGTCPSVGIVGFTLGGGYGDYSRMYGSGASNLLEAEVVLANGQIVKANECNAYRDLFWALRGGGGGFALVTKATFRTYAFPAQGTVNFANIPVLGGAEETLIKFFRWYHDVVARGLAKHVGGQVWLRRMDEVHLQLNFIGLDTAACTALLQSGPGNPLGNQRCIVTTPLARGNYNSPHAAGWAQTWSLNYASSYFLESMTRYVMHHHIAPGNSERLAAVLHKHASQMRRKGDVLSFSLNYVLGGSPVAGVARTSTSVHPQVTDAVGTIKLTRHHPRTEAPLSPNPPFYDSFNDHLQQFKTELEPLLPGAGEYSNEGDHTEPNWRERYWGSNYGALLNIKRKYDPNGIFNCNACVGSELSPPTCAA